jgi:type IV pilus assembly protein PilB
MAPRKRIGEVLVEACLISPAQLDEALRLQLRERKMLGQILIDLGWVTEHEVCRAVAELLNIKFIDVDGALISQDVIQLAPENLAAKRNILPLFIQDKILFLAMENPLDIDVIQRIEFRTGLQVQPLIAPPSQLRDIIRKHYDIDEYVGSMLAPVEAASVSVDAAPEAEEAVDVSEARRQSEGGQIIKLANLLIAEGVKRRASDIHIEPTARGVNVRYRVDGLLVKGVQVPHWLQQPLVSRLKILASLDIAEHRKPQDGRIRVSYMQRKIDLRVSTLPSNFGEKVVIRILDSTASAHDLTRLGLSSDHLRVYRGLIQQPQGLILVTGPTGSGKTTTLYASLNAVKDDTKNIVTVEDPIEYQLEGITQVQVNPKAGMTFASGLRSILRQDPNVILVGEIRDGETAAIAMQASETGHLVLSTLHTNDSVSTVNRLFSLGIAADLVAANLLAVVAQRLVRRICPKCKVAYAPDAKEWQQVGVSSAKHGVAAYKGAGCSACNHTGFYGQIGLYEIFAPTEQARGDIAKRPSKHALKQLAAEAGMTTMLEDGLAKIRQGLTTIAEVARVCAVEPARLARSRPCPACGAAVPEEAEDCPACRQRLHRLCEQCQAVLDEAWAFCPACGARTAQAPPSPPGVGEAPGTEPPAEAPGTEPPAEAPGTEPPAEAPGTEPPAEAPIRIVAADDDELVRNMIKLLLENKGYDVIPAVNGEDALAKIQAELPDLIILDVVMPKLDGFRVCKSVRAAMETMFTPIVMLTGQDSLEEKQRGLSMGADDYITKPFRADDLLERIAAALGRAYHRKTEAIQPEP